MLVRKLSLMALPFLLAACTTSPNSHSGQDMPTQAVSAEEITIEPTEAPNKAGKSVLAEAKAAQDEATQDQAQMAKETQSRDATFEHRLTLDKPVGTAVCTWQNSVGYVQKVEKDRIQIATKGRASTATHGAFFSSNPPTRQDITEQEGNVWTEGHDWAVCNHPL